jgi:hypothetical protein
MRPLPFWAWGCALLAALAVGSPSHAAWNNVFQVCCHSCNSHAPTTSSFYGDPCCPQPCPPPCPPACTTRYVQRTYCAPVTTYKTTTYSVPVTTYRTSYYYEACTSYRYSCVFDPCTCRYQRVAQPVTSYRLRSRCCPVTSYLQWTCLTPVTTMQTFSYYVPQTTCCTTTEGAPVATLPPGASVGAPPATAETRTPSGGEAERLPAPPPGTDETRDAGPASGRSGYSPPPMPPATDSKFIPLKPAPAVRFDRIASRGKVEGRVVDPTRVPRASAKVLFVSTAEKRTQFTTTTSGDGVFRADLPEGGWLVYTYDERGRLVFSRRIEVPADKPVNFTLVSR